MITANDVTDSMVEELHDARVLGEDWEADDIPNLIAVCANAYLAENPAAANGAELLATVKRVALDCCRDTAHVEECGSEEIAYLELDAEQWRKHCEAIVQAERVWEKARESKVKGGEA